MSNTSLGNTYRDSREHVQKWLAECLLGSRVALADGLRIIDWETFAWGDPMRDLGFLVGADRDLPEDEVEAVIAEYRRNAPVDLECLMWHRHRWSDSWKQRDK